MFVEHREAGHVRRQHENGAVDFAQGGLALTDGGRRVVGERHADHAVERRADEHHAAGTRHDRPHVTRRRRHVALEAPAGAVANEHREPGPRAHQHALRVAGDRGQRVGRQPRGAGHTAHAAGTVLEHALGAGHEQVVPAVHRGPGAPGDARNAHRTQAAGGRMLEREQPGGGEHVQAIVVAHDGVHGAVEAEPFVNAGEAGAQVDARQR
jgi:hypothetical protein